MSSGQTTAVAENFQATQLFFNTGPADEMAEATFSDLAVPGIGAAGQKALEERLGMKLNDSDMSVAAAKYVRPWPVETGIHAEHSYYATVRYGIPCHSS